MVELKKQELQKITGGGFSLGVFSLIGAGIVLLVGIIDGYLRPLACR